MGKLWPKALRWHDQNTGHDFSLIPKPNSKVICLIVRLFCSGQNQEKYSGQLHQQRLTSFALLPRRHRFHIANKLRFSISTKAKRQTCKQMHLADLVSCN